MRRFIPYCIIVLSILAISNVVNLLKDSTSLIQIHGTSAEEIVSKVESTIENHNFLMYPMLKLLSVFLRLFF